MLWFKKKSTAVNNNRQEFPRVLFSEIKGILPTGDRYDWKYNAPFIHEKDVFITSYPRCGNTWLRMMLLDLFWQLSGNDTRGVKLPILYFSPSSEKLDFSKLQRPEIGFFLIKTHNTKSVEHNRYIYLFRNPVDSIVSYYRYIMKRQIGFMEPGMEEFCIKEIANWNTNVRIGHRYRKNGLFFSYEDMLEHTEAACKKACEFIDFPATNEQIKIAVENHSRDNMKAILEKSGQQHEAAFRYAHGKRGAGKQYISDELKNWILKETKEKYEKIKALKYKFD